MTRVHVQYFFYTQAQGYHTNTSVSVTILARDVRFFLILQIRRNYSAGSKAWVCSRSLAGIEGSNPSGDMGLSLVNIVCCRVEVSATGRSIIQGSPPQTERERESVCVCVCVCVCHGVRSSAAKTLYTYNE